MIALAAAAHETTAESISSAAVVIGILAFGAFWVWLLLRETK